jgi:hypothetical protein
MLSLKCNLGVEASNEKIGIKTNFNVVKPPKDKRDHEYIDMEAL